MDYDIQEHRHRFAVWAAARAVARGFTTTEKVKRAIEASDLRDLVFSSPTKWPTEGVDELHQKWVDQILTKLEEDGVFNEGPDKKNRVRKEQSYGRAAKIIAVYLKTCLLMCPHVDHDFHSLIHPPIDRTLLQELSNRPEFSKYKSRWRPVATRWTQLTKKEYLELIASFREAGLDRPFWTIERYWHPGGGSAT